MFIKFPFFNVALRYEDYVKTISRIEIVNSVSDYRVMITCNGPITKFKDRNYFSSVLEFEDAENLLNFLMFAIPQMTFENKDFILEKLWEDWNEDWSDLDLDKFDFEDIMDFMKNP